MNDSKRWSRMTDIATADLEAFQIQKAAYEEELAQAQSQLDYLKEHHDQSERDIVQPKAYGSVDELRRRHVFLDSLREAMGQQDSLIQAKKAHLEQMRQHLLQLYQKRESYDLLASAEHKNQQQERDRREDEFLDDIANQNAQRTNPSV